MGPPTYSTRKVFHFIIEVITALATSHPEMAMKLFLQAAQASRPHPINLLHFIECPSTLFYY